MESSAAIAYTIVVLVLCLGALVVATLSFLREDNRGDQGESIPGPQGPNPFDTHILDQLHNIDETRISALTWQLMGSLEPAATTDNVLFDTVRTGHKSDLTCTVLWRNEGYAPTVRKVGTKIFVNGSAPGTESNLEGKFIPVVESSVWTASQWWAFENHYYARMTYSGPTQLFKISYAISVNMSFSEPVHTTYTMRTYLGRNGVAGPARTRIDHPQNPNSGFPLGSSSYDRVHRASFLEEVHPGNTFDFFLSCTVPDPPAWVKFYACCDRDHTGIVKFEPVL